MQPMPLPHFLMMLLAVIAAAGLTIFLAVQSGLSLAVLGLGVLIGAGLIRMLARVE
ncbi:hypothetical protein ACTTAK_11185 [Rhodobacter capsulatus]|uniref:hypothetical protein n=1 Tax=Rhodobacter capsulatus TaxID=1061 RepID=UPI0015E88644|nr:hypothetical protein [Rhodobacter capsulatus]